MSNGSDLLPAKPLADAPAALRDLARLRALSRAYRIAVCVTRDYPLAVLIDDCRRAFCFWRDAAAPALPPHPPQETVRRQG